jgi:hypothetical protein
MSDSPKIQFRKFQPQHHTILREEAQKSWFQTATTYALAQLADTGATHDELNGANRFIEILSNLGADEFKPVKLPVKSLKVLDGASIETDEINPK